MTTQSKPQGAKPSHTVYLVEGDGKDAKWTAIGAAWPNSDQQGYSLNCHGLRVVMRVARTKPRDQN